MTEKENAGKLRLEEAFLRYDRSFYDMFPIDNSAFRHTPGYEKRMQKLLFGNPSPASDAKRTPSLGKKTIIVLLAAALMAASVMGVTAISESNGGFRLDTGGYFMELISNGKETEKTPEKIEQEMLPTVPPSFQTDWSYVTEYEVKYIWSDADGERIIFTQLLLNAKSTMDNENANLEIRYLDTLRIACSEKNGLKSFYWNTAEYTFSLVVSDGITDEICMEMIRSIGFGQEEIL